MANYKQSFVLYESIYSTFERLMKAGKKDSANRYIDAVMQYGLYGVVPEENDEVWFFGLDNVMASIDSAKSNYRKKINIPKGELERYLQEGLTQAQIAEKFNCSVDTIQRRIKEYGLRDLPTEGYFFEDDTANCGMKTGRNYHSHFHWNSLSPSDSLLQRDEEEKNERKLSIKDLGF